MDQIRALWEATDDVESDVQEELQKKIIEGISRLDKNVRTKMNVARMVRSSHDAENAQVKLFPEDTPVKPTSRFEHRRRPMLRAI